MDLEWRRRFAEAPVARLATVTPEGSPHIVPAVFVLVQDHGEDVVWSPIDDKAKSTRALRRLTNIEAHPRVSVLVDHYTQDWSQLWWVRADGMASVEEVTTPGGAAAVAALREKYSQEEGAHLGPLIRIQVDTWRSWSAS